MISTARRTGVVLLLVSALVFSSAGIFTKVVEATAWEVIFWRAVFAALFTIIYIAWRGSMHLDFSRMGKWGLFVGVIGASGTAAFIPAFKLTSVANVSLIYAAAPLLAAVIAWFWIKEKPGWSTVVGCLAAFLGVLLIVSGSLRGLNLEGDLLALWMTLVLAIIMVVYRKFPHVPAAGPSVLSCLLLLPPALLLSSPFAIPTHEIIILAAFGMVFAVASVTLAEGAKRLPSGETGLLSSLEAPFAILLALLILLEVPPTTTFIGGVLIMAGVLGSQMFQTNKDEESPCQPQRN